MSDTRQFILVSKSMGGPRQFELTFDQWKRLVNRYLLSRTGLTSEDLPDASYWDSWASGVLPNDMADEVIETAGFDPDDF
jgi:hypothetical protein